MLENALQQLSVRNLSAFQPTLKSLVKTREPDFFGRQCRRLKEDNTIAASFDSLFIFASLDIIISYLKKKHMYVARIG